MMRSQRGRGLVKICGIQEPIHAAAAVAAGADLIGVVFAQARRRVTVEQAKRIVHAARAATTEESVATVGLFVNSSAAEIRAVVNEVDLDFIQLHGDEPPEMLNDLSRPVLRAMRLPPGTRPEEAHAVAARWLERPRPPVALLIDGFTPGSYGGTGAPADWTLATLLAREFPVLLAGGLTPVNVADAIGMVEPLGVDVSSGVETDQVKDPVKLAAFVGAARGAFGGVE